MKDKNNNKFFNCDGIKNCKCGDGVCYSVCIKSGKVVKLSKASPFTKSVSPACACPRNEHCPYNRTSLKDMQK